MKKAWPTAREGMVLAGGGAVGRYGGPRLLVVAVLLTAVPPYCLTASAQCPDGSPPPCRVAPRPVSPPAPPSIAVLYFANLSPDSADAYLADGITEELIARLGMTARLKVKSRTAVERFRRGEPNPAAVGRVLAVTHLVNGSVRRSGERLRVTVELVRAATGDRVWGQQYDRIASDMLSLEAEVAAAVVTALVGRLLPAEHATLAGAGGDPAAHDHWLRGNHFLARRTPETVRRAIAEYERALAIEPSLVRAEARIAYAYDLFLDWGWTFPGVAPESVAARALRLAQGAARRAPGVSDVWMALGFARFHASPGSGAGVAAAFDSALALDPGNAEALHQFGSVLMGLGDSRRAVAVFRQALDLEPDRVVTLFQLGMMQYLRRDYTAARRWLDSALVVAPEFYFAHRTRSRVRLALGDLSGARADAAAVARLGANQPLWWESGLAMVEVAHGDTAAGRARVGRLRSALADSAAPTAQQAWFLGAALVATGQRDAALQVIARCRSPYLWALLQSAEFDPIRDDPRFGTLLAAIRPRGAP